MSATTEYGKRITADYVIKSTFAKGVSFPRLLDVVTEEEAALQRE
jgi:hypothetical protein